MICKCKSAKSTRVKNNLLHINLLVSPALRLNNNPIQSNLLVSLAPQPH